MERTGISCGAEGYADTSCGKDHGGEGTSGGGGGYGTGENGEGPLGGNEAGGGDNPGQGKKPKYKTIPLSTRRLIAVNINQGEYLYKLKASVSSQNATIEIRVSAEDGYYSPDIISASIDGQEEVKLDKNKLTGVAVNENQMIVVRLHIKSSDYTSFEVNCYETKSE